MFFFLPIVLFVYEFVPSKLKNIFLLFASLIFYAWTEWNFLPYILTSIAINWFLSHQMSRSKKYKKSALFLGIVQSVGLLIYSRYTVAHLGLSFFTFHSISYLVDIYKNVAKPVSLINLGIYSIFFPQVSAGPINQYSKMYPQIITKKTKSINQVSGGIELFIFGLGQKMLLANTLSIYADQVFSFTVTELSFGLAWLGIIAYTLQIYFDFLGYTNMALGLGSMFGYELTQNFNLPYISRSITEFWSRWHISLTNWLRIYIYFPLGGSKLGNFRTYLNILVVFLISGIWHGSGWNYVVWGLWHALFMIVERVTEFTKIKLPQILFSIYTLCIVMFGWVMFRSPNLTYAFEYITVLLGKNMGVRGIVDWLSYITPYTLLIFTASILLSFGINIPIRKRSYMYYVFISFILILSLIKVAGSTYTPFIYNKF